MVATDTDVDSSSEDEQVKARMKETSKVAKKDDDDVESEIKNTDITPTHAVVRYLMPITSPGKTFIIPTSQILNWNPKENFKGQLRMMKTNALTEKFTHVGEICKAGSK